MIAIIVHRNNIMEVPGVQRQNQDKTRGPKHHTKLTPWGAQGKSGMIFPWKKSSQTLRVTQQQTCFSSLSMNSNYDCNYVWAQD